MRLFYFTDVFPSVSQTFISRELAALEKLGADIAIMSLSCDQSGFAGCALDKNLRVAIYCRPDQSCTKMARVFHHVESLAANPIRYLRVRNLAAQSDQVTAWIYRQLPTYCRIIKRFGPQHLHAHFGWSGMLVAWLASRLLRIPFSVTLHGSDVLVSPSPRLGDAVRDAARVVCVSENIRKVLLSHYPLASPKTDVIHCGIDLTEFPFAPKVTPSLRILTVARLHPVKGLADLLVACAILRDRGVVLQCTIVGDGPERSRLTAQIQRDSLTGTVQLLGALPNEKLPSIYQSHSLFVLPSYSEGMGVVLMEAMASGLPIIATRVGGIPEIVEDGTNGTLVPAGKPELLANAIAEFTQKCREDVEAIRIRNRQRIIDEFDIQQTSQRLFDLFAQTSFGRAN